MKNIILKKLAALCLSIAMVCTMCACGSGASASSQSTNAKFEGDSVEGALKGVTLSFATSGLFAPFTYYDTDGKTLIGFDLDVINELKNYLGFEIKDNTVEAMDYSAITASVASGKIDIALAALSMTDERKQAMNFTDPYYTGGKYLIINKDTSPKDLTSVEQLKDGNYKCAVEKGTSSHLYLQKLGVPDSAIEVHDTITTAYESLEQGMVDCMIQDSPSFAVYVKTKENTKLESVGDEFATDDTYGIAISFEIAKTHPDIVDIFNRALKDLTDSGKMDELKAKWCK